MVSFDLKGRIVLVTGASRGIGRAVAETLADQGAEIILVSRKLDRLEAAAAEIREKGGRAAGFACNMGSLPDIDTLCEEIRKRYGRLDILVNNAATNPYFGEMAAIDESAWGKTLDVNLKGPFFMIQKTIPLMQAAGGGAVVNVSSVNGIRPAAFQGVYSITKGALITMTRAFAKELAPHRIRVNALLPGFTDTNFSSVLMNDEEIYKMVVDQIPLGRHAAPAEMTGAVLYLVSEAASYTTGACLTCDGGLLA
ncbi:short-chain dehydrogenase [Desulfosarcina alkanivorans]|uniref:Short-chain dehydrogenase n=1 Tax=Desulfosarcina alkanivorans TaxID=571177 RepID=A0A5K7YH45_9BACT|nr:SDR family oxidoreductase [Desulfosarcina alkanivorans]BBO67883.1 short-chain dehydrogenase [Desulfosarcina alkanivorans]